MLSSAITGIIAPFVTLPSMTGSPFGVGCSMSSSFAPRVASTNLSAPSTE